MRALEPRVSGVAINGHDGVRVHYEVFGPEVSARTVLLLPTWSLVNSRVWKMQVPFLASICGHQVVTFDGRGNGKSDRPPEGYRALDFMQDALAVMDAAGVETADVVGFSSGARWGAYLAGLHPDRVRSLLFIASAVFIRSSSKVRLTREAFLSAPPDREGSNKYNAVHWREDLPDFVHWFARQIFTEPHSTKGQDDIEEWARGTTPEVLVQTILEGKTPELEELWPALEQPVALVHGDEDAVTPLSLFEWLAEQLPHAELHVVRGGGHAPHLRDPVLFNLYLRDFLARVPVGDRRGHARA